MMTQNEAAKIIAVLESMYLSPQVLGGLAQLSDVTLGDIEDKLPVLDDISGFAKELTLKYADKFPGMSEVMEFYTDILKIALQSVDLVINE